MADMFIESPQGEILKCWFYGCVGLLIIIIGLLRRGKR